MGKDTVVTRDATMYVRWKQNGGTPGPVKEFTVTFDSQGGSYSISHTAAWS